MMQVKFRLSPLSGDPPTGGFLIASSMQVICSWGESICFVSVRFSYCSLWYVHVTGGSDGRNLVSGVDSGLGVRHCGRTGSEVEGAERGHHSGVHGPGSGSGVLLELGARELRIRPRRRRAIRDDVWDCRSDGVRGAEHVELE